MANTVRVTVGDPDNILTTDMYGTGAIIRLQSCATVGGTYSNEATATVVSGTMEYELFDADGSAATWYQTRFESLDGTKASGWEGPFQSPEDGTYLSVDQFRLFSSTALSDDALLVLLRAATQAIVDEVGYTGARTEWLKGNGPLLMLSRPAVTVTSIVENDTTLDATDYEVSESGRLLRRLDTGTNPRTYWYGAVDVTYIPRDDVAERQRVQRELVALDLAYQPGIAQQTIGTWSESYVQGRSYEDQRAALLASLHSGGVMIL